MFHFTFKLSISKSFSKTKRLDDPNPEPAGISLSMVKDTGFLVLKYLKTSLEILFERSLILLTFSTLE